MKTRIITCIVALILLLGNSIHAQVETDTLWKNKLCVITLTDKREYVGYVLSDDGRELLIQTDKLGKIYIPKYEVVNIIPIHDQKEIVFGEFQSEGPFTTRYAFTTNALPIKRGENYAMINLYGPEVHFAVRDNFNIGIMTTWMASPMILSSKYSFKTKNEKLNFSIGALVGTSGYLNVFRGYGGLYFANFSVGSRKKNFTLAGGFAHLSTGFETNVWAEGTYVNSDSYWTGSGASFVSKSTPMLSGPIVSIAGITPVGAKASLVFDSMFGIFSSTRYSRISTTELVAPVQGYYDPNPPYSWIPGTPGTYSHVVENVPSSQLALFIMPGMRFQTKEKRAFQISLAGIAVFRQKGFEDYNDKSFSFPIPMCSWFFKF
ncbi:MAG: hypothetical protein IPM77_03980 [Crocinitomicaceae bacterium]|nr:hypothetical protein [Crocinitomicaceae bacterium]